MSLKDTHRALEKCYKELVKLFDEETQNAPMPMITIQTKGRRNALGWFGGKIWKEGKDIRPEINLSAEYLNRGFYDLMETLVHEMVHYSNYLKYKSGVHNKPDCNVNQYHNRIFRDACLDVGLNCEQDGNRGWSATSLTSKLRARIRRIDVDRKVFDCHRLEFSSVAKQPTKMKKWSCDCGTNIRAAVDLDITCNKCGERLERR